MDGVSTGVIPAGRFRHSRESAGAEELPAAKKETGQMSGLLEIKPVLPVLLHSQSIIGLAAAGHSVGHAGWAKHVGMDVRPKS